MTDELAASEQISTANVKQKSSGFSPVWIIPILAALIGGWMVFKSALNENTIIEVSFKDASGVEADKTVVKYRDIEIGKVTAVNFSRDLATINLTLEFEDVPAESFTKSTRFWIVKPRVGLGGVSGLETLLSGSYIELDPSGIEGEPPVSKFVGLEQPELLQLGNPGTSYILKTDSLGSLSRQSPVKFRDLSVGVVTGYKLTEDNSSIEVEIFVREPFDKLVKSDTRFWNISGIEVEAGAEGIKLNMASVTTLVSGGIAFSASESATASRAEAGSVFPLFENEKEDPKQEAVKTAFRYPMKLYFENGVKGLAEGAPVEYKGLRLGTVTSIAGTYDKNLDIFRTFATVDLEPNRLLSPGHENLDRNDKERAGDLEEYLEVSAARGLRAQLRSGNLLTGQSLVVFDHFPDEKPRPITYESGMMVFPTIPESLDNIISKIDATVTKVDEILAKVNRMPIAEIGDDLAQTMDSINAIPFTEIGNNLAQTSAKIEAVPYGQTVKDLNNTLANLNALLESLNAAKGGVIGVEARNTLAEITKAANALRGMAEYLERHPEALLKGKRSP